MFGFALSIMIFNNYYLPPYKCDVNLTKDLPLFGPLRLIYGVHKFTYLTLLHKYGSKYQL